jgi:PAS domain S-box-containing protein
MHADNNNCSSESGCLVNWYTGLQPVAQAALLLLLTVFYFLASKFGLMMAVSAQQVTLVWPPTGIALAAVLLFGYRVWPALTLGAFLANLTANETVLVAMAICIGNTLEALTGAWLLRRFVNFNAKISRLTDAWGLLLFSGLFSTVLSATIGVTALCLSHTQPWSSFSFLWLTWWLGDAGGAMIVAPALLVWLTPPHTRASLRQILEFVLLTACVAVYAIKYLIVSPLVSRQITYLIFLFVIWAALRFGQRGTTLVTLGISASAVWATLHGTSPFIGDTVEQSLVSLDIFMLTVAVTGLFLSAALAERKETERLLEASKSHMRLIFDGALDAVITIDKNGLVTEWNKQAETIFGWAAGEVMGKEMSEIIIPPSYRDMHKRGFLQFLRNGTSKILNKRIEMEGLTRAGEIIPIELAITVQKNMDYFFTAFIRDIRLEKQAESTRALLSSIVESSSDAVISKTPEGIITSWNVGAERLFGYSAEEAVGKSITILIPPDRLDEERSILSNIHEGKRIEAFETVRLAKDGRPLAVSVTISPIRDSAGNITGASKIVRDIADRKEATQRLQAAHKYLNDVLNHIPDPIFMKDRQHRWIGGNKAFWEFMGDEPEKFVGKSDYDFFPKEEADHFWEMDDKVFNSNEVNISEELFTDSKGERHTISTKKIAFLDEKNEQFLVGVIRDITDVKRAEERVMRYTKELERSNKELDDFAYIASHDMKEPLRGLLNFSQFLKEDYNDKLDEKGREYIEKLILLSRHMNQLIEDLLYFSRLGRAELAMQEVDPNIIIKDLQKIMETTLKEKNAQIVIPHPMPHIVCDKPGITEVFRNLITNATKYNDKPEKTIEIGMLESAESPTGMERSVFYVKDNGIGIDPKFHQAIFQIFKRLESSARYDKSGTGVGLTFVKKIIDRNKGNIWLQSQSGKGTTFYFTFRNKY